MRLFILSFFLVLNISYADVFKKEKIVLLTSFIETETITKKRNEKVEREIEISFRKNYRESPFDIEVVHLTGPDKLWRTLNDKQVVGLFWISHAKKETFLGEGLSDPSSILDAYGNNVKDLFKKVTPSLKFLAIIGCEAKALFDDYREEGYYTENLTIFSFEKKVNAISGYKKALARSVEIFLSPSDETNFAFNSEEDFQKIYFHFEGLSSLKQKIVKIELGNEILALEKISFDWLVLQIDQVKFDLKKNKNIKITIMSNEENIKLPKLEISLGRNHFWKLFEKNGEALGEDKNLYLYRGGS